MIMIDDSLFQPELFDPIIPLINSIDGLGRIEIAIPSSVNLDIEQIKAYFTEDATIHYHRDGETLARTFTGTIRSKTLLDYLTDKFLNT